MHGEIRWDTSPSAPDTGDIERDICHLRRATGCRGIRTYFKPLLKLPGIELPRGDGLYILRNGKRHFAEWLPGSSKTRRRRLGRVDGSPITETVYTPVISEEGKHIAGQLGDAVWEVLDRKQKRLRVGVQAVDSESRNAPPPKPVAVTLQSRGVIAFMLVPWGAASSKMSSDRSRARVLLDDLNSRRPIAQAVEKPK